jgi:thymidylate synthase
MNKLDKEYQMLLEYILGNGVEKKDRTGTGTISVFGTQIRHNMKDGFPLLTTKRMAVKTMMTELKWFLKGDTNIKYLVDNGCKVWNGDAYKKYRDVYEIESRESDSKLEELHMLSDLTELEFIDRIKGDDEFAEKWGELGPIYGKQWRDWDGRQERDGSYDMSLDQIANLIFQLKRNPDSRRLMVSAWNVGELSEMTLPPCHYGFQMYTRELTFDERYEIYSKSDQTWEEGGGNAYGKITAMDLMDDGDIPTRSISLMWNQRSVDTFLGLPFNISSYGALLCLIAEEVNMVPDELIGNLGDTHLYSNHIEQANEQVSRDAYPLPTIKFSNIYLLGGEFDYEVIDYKYHPSIKAPLSN